MNCLFHGYKKEEPIFVKDVDGKIYPIDEIPNREFNVSTDKKIKKIAYVNLLLHPELANRPDILGKFDTLDLINNAKAVELNQYYLAVSEEMEEWVDAI